MSHKTMSHVRVGGIELRVIDQGVGTPLLLVHGFPLDHTMWRGQLAGLAGVCRILAPDLRGFGQSQVTSGTVSMEQFADDLAGLLDALRVTEPVMFCGLSMGGYVAWQFWRRHAARLRALILCDTRAVADSEQVATGRRVSAQSVLADGPSALIESLIPKLFAESTRRDQPQVVAETRDVIATTSRDGIAAALRGMADRVDMTDQLPHVTVPTLCLAGAHDVISPPQEMQGFAQAMPSARFCSIDNAGHMSPLEQPQAVNAEIHKFLRECSAAK